MIMVFFTRPVTDIDKFAAEMQATRQAHRVIHVGQETFGGFETIGPNFLQINTTEQP